MVASAKAELALAATAPPPRGEAAPPEAGGAQATLAEGRAECSPVQVALGELLAAVGRFLVPRVPTGVRAMARTAAMAARSVAQRAAAAPSRARATVVTAARSADSAERAVRASRARAAVATTWS